MGMAGDAKDVKCAQPLCTFISHHVMKLVVPPRMYCWWSLRTWYLLACQVELVTTGDSGLSCCLPCLPSARFFPLFVEVVGTLISSCPSVHVSLICRDDKSSKVRNPLFKITHDANDSVHHSNLIFKITHDAIDSVHHSNLTLDTTALSLLPCAVGWLLS